MDHRLLAVMEPRPGEAERRPPAFGEADRVDMEGDRRLEVSGAHVHVMEGYGRAGLRSPRPYDGATMATPADSIKMKPEFARKDK
jgi:hypothetical protein